MSEREEKVDLEALARPRSAPSKAPRRRMMVWLLPLLVVIGLLGLLAYGGMLDGGGGVVVRVVRPVAAGGEVVAPAGQVVTAAAGWIEAEPHNVAVAPLIDGTLATLLVVEGQTVAAGDTIGTLVADDARLSVDQAVAALAVAEAELQARRVTLRFAQKTLDHPTALTARQARAEAELEGAMAARDEAKAAVSALDAAIGAAREELALEIWLLEAKATEPRKVSLARARLAEVKARVGGLAAAAARAEAAVQVAQANLEEAREDLTLRIPDQRALAEAQEAVQVAEAAVQGKRADLATAELALARTTVRAPMAGRVLHQHVVPGELAGPGRPLCHLYDPQALRVRADLPLEELRKVAVGQKVEILAESRRDRPYAGEVTGLLRQADIQKVTLEVRVRVLDPDDLLVPEGLVQVRFLGDGKARGGAGPEIAGPQQFRLPVAALQGDQVYRVRSDGHLEAVAVRRVQETAGLVTVGGPLTLADRIVVAAAGPLAVGAKVEVQR